MPFLLALLKKLAINFVFEFLWEQLMKWLAEQVEDSENKFDDELLKWFGSKKPEIENTIKDAVK